MYPTDVQRVIQTGTKGQQSMMPCRLCPELADMFLGEDPTLSALARDWAEYFTADCDYELRAILAGAALEHKRRNLKVCKPWLDDLSVL